MFKFKALRQHHFEKNKGLFFDYALEKCWKFFKIERTISAALDIHYYTIQKWYHFFRVSILFLSQQPMVAATNDF